MGGFIVLQKDAEESVESVEVRCQRTLEVFQKKGLKLDVRFVRDGFVAYRYSKLFPLHEEAIQFENGDFAFYTGTFIYDAHTGKDALGLFYKDYVAGNPIEQKISGNFHLLIYANGELSSIGDYCGYYPVYIDDDTKTISNSYLAIGRLGGARQLCHQALHEYIFHGFFVEHETLLRGIRILDSRRIWRLNPTVSSKQRAPAYDPLPASADFDQIVESVSSKLADYFGVLARLYPREIGSALSGGYDTRHMLCLLRQAGVNPYLHVYGSASSSDVIVAREIARGENLPIEHIDKGSTQKIDADEFAKNIERDVFFFDAIKPVGLINDGTDFDTRIERARHAHLQLNGAGGEIYREIWNVSDREIDLVKFLRMRFDQGSYEFCQGKFDQNEYFAQFAEKVRRILGINRKLLRRREAEMLFPFLRNRFCQANNSANSQISDSLLPFMEPQFVFPSFDIPIQYKYCGAIHAALIRTADPALARYQSSYGINFSDPIPMGYRARRMAERQVPLGARLMVRKLRAGRTQPMPSYLSPDYVGRIVNTKSMAMAEFFDVAKINDPEVFSRVLSVELLLKHL